MNVRMLVAGGAAVTAAVLATLGAAPARQDRGSGQAAQNAAMVVYKSPT
jgi:hypothetical protein